ncbi:MAG: molecular chaperone HtpG [Chloroflexota bacterium]|nr:molecular chaperone HtpG [Chloroflexota bacterium]
MAKTNESLAFKTEVQQLLHILAHSLYTEREIFLRELISNASDSLHRMQFEMLTNRDVVDPDVELGIQLNFDKEAGTLTISDTGIGMTREELIENLGTIAHSGALAFLQHLGEGEKPADIIGQFGVGFYSVFMVAAEVRVTTRSYHPESQAWTWTSAGKNSYTLAPAGKLTRGTEIEIQLNTEAEEFASTWRLEQIIRKHSNYISFPIQVGEKIINQQNALWRTPRNKIEEEEYNEFYRQLSLDPQAPLLHLHLVTDVPVYIRSILYVPGHLNEDRFRLGTKEGLRLYSKKILIQEENRELLPEYLRFVEGVVDSEDLPLNISRETVQSNRIMRQIQRSLTSKVLGSLQELATEDPDKYQKFWEEFGPFIKQGIAANPFSHDDLLPLIRFRSSRSDGELISFADYVARMTEAQPAIYYIIGENLDSVAHSPHLDYFKGHELEVLYLVDPLDGLMMQSLREYEEHPFQNVDDANLELPATAEADEDTEEEVAPDDFGALLVQFKQVLDERVVDVRASKVLRGSPCRLVSAESGPERDLERVRRLLEQDFEIPPRILEINQHHPLIHNLAQLLKAGSGTGTVEIAIEQLFANQLLMEGLHPHPAEMVPRIEQLLAAATEEK